MFVEGNRVCTLCRAYRRAYTRMYDDEDKLFNELVESIKEMGSYLRGEIEIEPSRIHFVGEPDLREIRAKLGMTQEEFAAALCISVKTLRN